jgi:hypothetical protein
MDEYDARSSLKRIYKLENRSVKLGSEDEYVDRNIAYILKQGNGVWSSDKAQEHIEMLEKSV